MLLKLASALRHLERYEEAKICCKEALAWATRPDDREIPVRLLHNELGLIARDRGYFDEARHEFEQSLSLAIEQSDAVDVAVSRNSLGTLLLKPLPREAAAMFEETLNLLDSRRDTLRIAQVLNNLGMAYANLSDWRKSESYYERSLDIKREANDLFGQASTYLNLARVLEAQNKFIESRDALTRSADLFEAVRASANAAISRRELARLLLKHRDISGAAVESLRAVSLFGLAGDHHEATATQLEFRAQSRLRRACFWLIGSVIVILLAVAIFLVLRAIDVISN